MDKEGYILKPVQKGPRGEREVAFYETITSSTDKDVVAFNKFTPKFFGTKTRKDKDGEDNEFLAIENMTKGMAKACVMDVKVGAKTYSPDATDEKKAAEDAKYVGTKKPFGFSVLGMNVFAGEKMETAKVWDKDFGKKLTGDNMSDVLNNYLNTAENDPEAVQVIADCFLDQLSEILALFRSQKKFHMFGSSLLFVYDAEAILRFCETRDKDALRDATRLRMIDFAHVFLEDCVDANYVFGVENIGRVLFKDFK